MSVYVKLFSNKEHEIYNFLKLFYEDLVQNKTDSLIESALEWQKEYQNPIEIADIIGTFIENNDKFKINMWISLDKDVLINVTSTNADEIIRYLFERYPY